MRNANKVKPRYVLREAVLNNGGIMPIVPDAMRILKGFQKYQIYGIISQIRKEFGSLETKYGKELWRVAEGNIYGLEDIIKAEQRDALNKRILAVTTGHARNSSIDCSVYSARLQNKIVSKRNKEYKKAVGEIEGTAYKFTEATLDIIDQLGKEIKYEARKD